MRVPVAETGHFLFTFKHIENFIMGGHCRQRHVTGRQSLAGDKKIGSDVSIFIGEHLAGTPKPG
ncbi:Archaeal DNA helicase HerA or a related bacterial ATPase [Pseudomonas syringae pv. actinidiae]|uniref:Archaeal DNA helicase HerA or a related bacterial ATPase n=1 Tax=Pseudomonas syringae pv. actinidiae TaxID=103796 RepID=A0AAN4Q0V1_PSESF|nr:Archaeal DNA helicase HerA or a related bacterial ATPase [Pseudomonas syringae pv. actinidiae]